MIRNETRLHGVPIREWIGRMMKSKAVTSMGNKSRHPCRVMDYDEKTHEMVVVPAKHKKSERVDPGALLPWWSRNDDLRLKYKVEDEDEEIIAQIEMTMVENRIGVALTQKDVPEDVPSATREACKPAETKKQPVQVSISKPDETLEFAAEQIEKIIVMPKANPGWMDDYKTLLEAISESEKCRKNIRKAEDALAEARSLYQTSEETVREFAECLARSGIEVVWKNETAAATAGTVARKRAAVGSVPIPKNLIEKSNNLSELLVARMVVGVEYKREELIEMIGMERTNMLDKVFGLAFARHPRLLRTPGGRNGFTYTLLP